jgi:hypothetical protein
MSALSNATPASSAAPPPAPVGARAVQRDAEAATDDQAAFERLMDREHAADAESADAPADPPRRSDDRAVRSAGDRVRERSGRGDASGDASGDATDDAARGTPPLAWALPYPMCGMASTIAPPVAAQTTDARPAWSEVSAYLERLFVEGGPQPGGGPAAMFTLRADVLVDTAVCLTRVAQGWSLRIDTRDRHLLVDARRHEAALRERFAQRGLGELTVELGEMPWAIG